VDGDAPDLAVDQLAFTGVEAGTDLKPKFAHCIADFTGGVDCARGTVEGGEPVEALWMDPVTENPAVGDTELWELYNTTGDAHPMHIHEVVFEVVSREGLVLDGEEVAIPIQLDGNVVGPEPWETGFKDTVIAYPAQVTRVKARFATAGQFVWHCHIVEHEDNEMMRPYRIGPMQPGQPCHEHGS